MNKVDNVSNKAIVDIGETIDSFCDLSIDFHKHGDLIASIIWLERATELLHILNDLKEGGVNRVERIRCSM